MVQPIERQKIGKKSCKWFQKKGYRLEKSYTHFDRAGTKAKGRSGGGVEVDAKRIGS
jgi:hypothetical protein